MRLLLISALTLLLPLSGRSQLTTSPVEGLRENTPRLHVLRGADVWLRSDKKIVNATIVLRDGLIEKVGSAGLKVPKNARIIDLTGKTVYAGFIEAAAAVDTPKEDSEINTHWNALIRPERRMAEFQLPEIEAMTELRELGFTSAHIIPDDGIFRGQSLLVNLNDELSVLTIDVLQCFGFERAYHGYPKSLMGTVALARQSLYDAIWYRDLTTYLGEHPETERPEENRALKALELVINKQQALLAEAEEELDYARIFDLAKEFELGDVAILGNGREYRQKKLLKNSGSTLIVPVDFPEAPPVENPETAVELSLEELEHWERAPANAADLVAEGIPICLTTYELEEATDSFWKQVRKAVKHGLTPENALASLTETPAALLGVSAQVGSIEPGKLANLVVANGDLFTEQNAQVHSVWIEGRRFEMKAVHQLDYRGTWSLEWDTGKAANAWVVSGKLDSPKLKSGEDAIPLKLKNGKILIFPPAKFFAEGIDGTARLSGHLNADDKMVRGIAYFPNGKSFPWKAIIGESNGGAADEEKGDENGEKENILPPFGKYPAGAFGIEKLPQQASAVLVRNASIWTSGIQGRLKNADLLMKNGKIVAVGENLPMPTESDVVVIDAKGKHVTPGLIDCHSHSAVSHSNNESSHSVVLEVRIADVINPTDIALYRKLAGGVTTSNILHGSSNPMGGQNQVIKVRWGSRDANGLRFVGAKPGVKFALGENVKRSNRSEKSDRYPQTRMGVEQIMKDTFRAAQDYERLRDEAKAKAMPYRRNLRLEAALEILNQQRIVHIHSYRQDEILMFVRLAQEFNIKVGAFQHVLEGYKVADAIAEIGAGASTFSDWWSYKFEVYDAIPYNGALLHNAGVVTSFNSDDNELATHLNTEAAKAVKYGGVSEEEALKFVTLNPARQLHIDKRVGSLEVGKDADFVIWSGSPLSSFSRVEQTWIDGRRYFDLESDQLLRKAAVAERDRLIALALPERIKAIKKNNAKKELNDQAEDKNPKHNKFYRHGSKANDQDLYHNGSDRHGHGDEYSCKKLKR